MKRLCRTVTLAVFLFLSPLTAGAETLLIPGGQAIGLHLLDDTVTVVAYDDGCAVAREAGIQIGDQLEAVNGTPVASPEEARGILEGAEGPVKLSLLRGGKRQSVTVRPGEGGRLGVYLRQGISGIGTVTFYDPGTGRFGTLGHGVSSTRGQLLRLRSGTAQDIRITQLKPGLPGDPGQLKGEADLGTTLGILEKNTPQGVFGQLDRALPGEILPAATWAELHTGPATIRCTLDGGGVQEYSVELLKIYPQTRSDSRNLLLRITDKALLEKTGGIIQGMSGSPIIQDGKLIGAVTHVLVNDPTTGYGIFIENMLDAAG